ncbi:Transmembrane domain-containing protein [Orpheovirus IHUMI-LCC2]|uniref:Transmembrane domain-containing protein n=1 Tax=Orpheovirus IHUMI-LCC2 TaxID=2023057 RepID=A0A2I2L3W2_9VIRU|nr:Transmembrane domain-containing protein [Orpheovirus IHUMI-LCC2]SNW62201.1 Transmembrane domain-containing protein [Orpheovirus IHUMI-LCC2]
MLKYLVILLFLSVNYSISKVIIEGYGKEFTSAQITPTGNMWPKFNDITAPLSIASPDVPCPYYKGTIVWMVIDAYMDEIIMNYKDCGAAGIIILGTSTYIPGIAIRYFRNQIPFTDVNNVYPVAELTPDDGTTVVELYKSIVTVNMTSIVYVTLTAEEGNVWKDNAYGPGMFLQVILLGAIYLSIAIWSIINIYRMIKYEMPHLKVPSILSALVGFGSVLRSIGFIDYEGRKQLMDYRAANFLSHAGIGFIFSACWFMSLLMLSIVDKSNLKIKLIMYRYLWPYIVVSILRVSIDWIFSILTVVNLTEYVYVLTTAIIWTSSSALMDLALAVIFIIGFVKVLQSRNASKRLQSKENRYDKSLVTTVILNLLISFFIILYFIFSLVAWFGLAGYPNGIFLFYFIQPMLLSFIALLLTISLHLRIVQHIQSSFTKSPTSSGNANTNSNKNTETELTKV